MRKLTEVPELPELPKSPESEEENEPEEAEAGQKQPKQKKITITPENLVQAIVTLDQRVQALEAKFFRIQNA